MTAGRAHRILLVEDNPGDAALIAEKLEEALSSVVLEHATTLAEAVRLLGERSYSVLLLDLNLPDSRELETVRRIKASAGETPIIVVSGAIPEDTRLGALREGVDDVIGKDEAAPQLFLRSVLYAMERYSARQQHRQLEQILEATPDAILVVNPQGFVRYVNPAATLLFGRSTEELLSERFAFAIDETAATELWIEGASHPRICERRAVPIEWNREQVHLVVLHDITERVHAEQLRELAAELQLDRARSDEASRMKSAFVANMSHELRTPLNAIVGFAALLYENELGPLTAGQREFVGDILESGRYMMELINEALDLAKVEAGKLEIRVEPFKLPRAIAEVAELMRATAAEKHVQLRIDCDPAINMVELDPRRLQQILYNYLSNAIKFSPEGAEVIIRTRAQESAMVRIEVEDAGPGIAAADQAKLFTEFQQLETASGGRRQGTGLGLALTKRLVEAQGGTVAVRSVVGQGSVFEAVLPRRAPRAG